MTDGDTEWFSKETSTGVSAVLRYSQVTFFVDAEEYYADLRQVTNAGEQRGDGLACWIGFDASSATAFP